MGTHKGIILAGGRGTRLYPLTKAVCKQLLPVYDKPMVYYPLSVLMLGNIRDILIITAPGERAAFQKCLGDGSHLGIKISYAEQSEPRGIAEALTIGEKFIGKDNVCLILGDNIFYGHDMQAMLKKAANNAGATVFAYPVKDPQRYGVISFDKNNRPVSIEEKPKSPKSRWALTGMYFFDAQAAAFARKVKPSKRGELEIADVLKGYLAKDQLNVVRLSRGYAWLDTGTYDSLVEAALFIKTIEDRQGLKVSCLEEIAYTKGFITRKQLLGLADGFKTSYAEYLHKIASEY